MPHPPILETACQTWVDEGACAASAAAFAHALLTAMNTVGRHSMTLTLNGDLGAGKTTFTRHLLHALGVVGRVKSPTYAVMESYTVTGPQGHPWPVSHFDFYRFRDPQEWEDAGFRDVFSAAGLRVCEWPERAEGLLPTPDIALNLQMAGAHVGDEASPAVRHVEGAAYTGLGCAVLSNWRSTGGGP